MIKRLFDVLLSLFGLVILSPVLLIVMFLVWKQDNKSPFYIALRSGKQKKNLKLLSYAQWLLMLIKMVLIQLAQVI